MVPGVYDDAYKEALRLRDEKNYTFIHPFDDENVIAGQGTIGLEILNEMPDVDAVVAAIGGGGLLSGVACAIKNLNPNIKVYGVQAEGAPSMLESIKGSLCCIAFIENKDDDHIRVRLRSRFMTVNTLAEQYRGGGHAKASGATLYAKEEMDEMLAKADTMIKEYKESHDDWL